MILQRKNNYEIKNCPLPWHCRAHDRLQKQIDSPNQLSLSKFSLVVSLKAQS